MGILDDLDVVLILAQAYGLPVDEIRNTISIAQKNNAYDDGGDEAGDKKEETDEQAAAKDKAKKNRAMAIGEKVMGMLESQANKARNRALSEIDFTDEERETVKDCTDRIMVGLKM